MGGGLYGRRAAAALGCRRHARVGRRQPGPTGRRLLAARRAAAGPVRVGRPGDDFDPATSDVDFFYEFDPGQLDGLADRYFALHDELEQALGRPVDLASLADVTNPYFLQVANRHRACVYAAGVGQVSA